MNVEVNMVAVLLATVASMVLGAIWYAQPVFGKMWMGYVGIKETGPRKGMAVALLQGLVCAFLTAYIIAHVAYLSNQFFHNSFMQDSVSTAFWLWLGISATTVVTHNAFEGRRKKLTLMTVAHQLVGYLIIGAIIGAVGP